jgi:hypothetical protein
MGAIVWENRILKVIADLQKLRRKEKTIIGRLMDEMRGRVCVFRNVEFTRTGRRRKIVKMKVHHIYNDTLEGVVICGETSGGTPGAIRLIPGVSRISFK